MNLQTILAFLKELKSNNNRDWFNENRKQYENAKREFEGLTNSIIPKLYDLDPQIGTPNAKKSIFRIFRDVRFSKDKSPYKTNFGCFIAKGGRKGGHAGYYFHVEPGKSFVGGGMYMPPSDILKKVRSEVMYHVDEFKGIIQDKAFRKYFDEIEGEKLKRPPKGFPADFPDIELLKMKSYVVLKPLDDNQIVSEGLGQYVINAFGAMVPLVHFLNRAMD
ncbi:MAG: DUF2461 domain-containing protein [Chlorobi bacterium]|nr:DUF2461 domain-containing protein [Chlorobiota bacterium]